MQAATHKLDDDDKIRCVDRGFVYEMRRSMEHRSSMVRSMWCVVAIPLDTVILASRIVLVNLVILHLLLLLLFLDLRRSGLRG